MTDYRRGIQDSSREIMSIEPLIVPTIVSSSVQYSSDKVHAFLTLSDDGGHF